MGLTINFVLIVAQYAFRNLILCLGIIIYNVSYIFWFHLWS